MMTCTLNGGHDMGADQETMRRTPGKIGKVSISTPSLELYAIVIDTPSRFPIIKQGCLTSIDTQIKAILS